MCDPWPLRVPESSQGIWEAKISKIYCWIKSNQISRCRPGWSGTHISHFPRLFYFVCFCFVWFWDRDTGSSGYKNSTILLPLLPKYHDYSHGYHPHFFSISKWCAYMSSYWFLDVIDIILFTSNHQKFGFLLFSFFLQNQKLCATLPHWPSGRLLLLFICMGVILPTCMSVSHVYSVPQRPEKGVGSHGTGVTGGCQPPRGWWEPNLGPLEEQPVSRHLLSLDCLFSFAVTTMMCVCLQVSLSPPSQHSHVVTLAVSIVSVYITLCKYCSHCSHAIAPWFLAYKTFTSVDCSDSMVFCFVFWVLPIYLTKIQSSLSISCQLLFMIHVATSGILSVSKSSSILFHNLLCSDLARYSVHLLFCILGFFPGSLCSFFLHNM